MLRALGGSGCGWHRNDDCYFLETLRDCCGTGYGEPTRHSERQDVSEDDLMKMVSSDDEADLAVDALFGNYYAANLMAW